MWNVRTVAKTLFYCRDEEWKKIRTCMCDEYIRAHNGTKYVAQMRLHLFDINAWRFYRDWYFFIYSVLRCDANICHQLLNEMLYFVILFDTYLKKINFRFQLKISRVVLEWNDRKMHLMQCNIGRIFIKLWKSANEHIQTLMLSLNVACTQKAVWTS